MRTLDPSLRPAEILPPTLLPNPVRAVAPHPDRLMSFLAACACYGAIAAIVIGGTRRMAAHTVAPRTVQVVMVDPPAPVAPPAQLPPPPPAGFVRPQGFKAVDTAVDPNLVPDEVVDLRDLPDHSHDLPAGTDSLAGPRIDGAQNNLPRPSVREPAMASQPIELEMQQVRVLQQVNPVYPALARHIRAEGVVDLRLTIDAQGVPTDIQVVSGPHPLLIAEAVRVAKLWRFQPAMIDGAAVPAWFRLKVGFRLAR